MRIFGREFGGSKEAKVAAAVGAALAGEGAMMHNAEAAMHTDETRHEQKMENTERTFINAKQAVIDLMNESTFDMTSGGKLEGNGWEATVKQETDGTIVVAISAGGDLKEYVVRGDEIDDGKGNLTTVYSMNTGLDRHEEKAMAEARDVVKAAKDRGGDSGPVATEDGQ